jgi:PKD repeat protein
VKLRATNVTGSDSIIQTNYITVVARPNTPNIKNTGSLLLCTGDSVLLSTDSSNVRWYANDGLIAQNVMQVYAKTTGLYRAALSNGTCEESATMNVIVSDKPTAPAITASVTGTMLCPDAISVLTSDAAAGNQWYRNMVPISGATAKTYSAGDSGSYTVVSMPGGCPSDHSPAKTYGLHARPAAGSISGPENPRRDETVTFTVPAQTGHTFQWTVTKGSIISGNNTESISARFTVIDSATVSVVSKQTSTGCTSEAATKRLLVAPAVGLNEYPDISSVSVYPVPVSAVLHLDIEGMRAHAPVISIVNVFGQVVMSESIHISTGKQRHSLDVSALKKGIYFIELQSPDNKLVKKIIVE